MAVLNTTEIEDTKTKDIIRKGYTAGLDIKDDERAIIFCISSIAVDRDNEVMLPKGCDLKAYRENPVVLWAHSYHDPPIGRAEGIKTDDKGIIAKTVFAETAFAEEIYSLYKGKFLRGASVGFRVLDHREPTEKDIKEHPEWEGINRIISKWELLEFSAVPVPANREALAVAVGKGLKLSDELKATFSDSDDGWLEDQEGDEEEDSETIIELESLTVGAVLKPYPNEHACRLADPGQFDRFARKKCEIKHDGKCIDVIYGIKAGKSQIQALRYKKEVWTAASARSHCKGKDGTFEAASEAAMELSLEAKEATLMKQRKIISDLQKEIQTLKSKVRKEGVLRRDTQVELNEKNLELRRAEKAVADFVRNKTGIVT